MTFRVGYLTPREASIWDLRRKNHSQSEIGRKLGVSRQAVHKAYQLIDKKVEQAFMAAAEINNLEVKNINLVEGVMSAHGIPVVVSLSNANGMKVWYLYDGNCKSCQFKSSCRSVLETEAEERGISLHVADQLTLPTHLVYEIFGRYQDD